MVIVEFTGDKILDDMDGQSLPPINAEADPNHERADELRRKVKYFFMNPCEKWKAKRKFPWKLVLQLVKLILVTTQLAMFGTSRSSHVDFLEKSNLAFHHLFLKEWEPGYETMPYPPATGEYAVYTIPDFYAYVNFAMEQFDKTEELAIGTFHFSRPNNTHEPMQLCKTRFKKGMIWAFNQSYIFDNAKISECFDLHQVEGIDNKTGRPGLVYDTEKYLSSINQTIHFDRVIEISLVFTLKTVHLKYLSRISTPDCFHFHIKIHYDNTEHNGQMLVTLKSRAEPLHCHGRVDGDDRTLIVLLSIFDVICLIVSILSLFLCMRSIIKAMHLLKVTVQFFKEHGSGKLCVYDKLEFLNMWYVLIVINDLLTVIGSIYKIRIENKWSNDYEVCGVLLGTGNLLVWFGVLRYLGFFGEYNILILTMKKSAPKVLRFLVCAGVFYVGFTICGWVVLGPYHIKFRQLSTASECLFSLVNGDDMFTTFAAINDMGSYVWWYSRIYLYCFISLFIYVVLSVFISVIMGTYETIKDYNVKGFPKSTLQEFADQCTDEPHILFRSESTGASHSPGLCIFPCIPSSCCDRRHSPVGLEEPDESSRLI